MALNSENIDKIEPFKDIHAEREARISEFLDNWNKRQNPTSLKPQSTQQTYTTPTATNISKAANDLTSAASNATSSVVGGVTSTASSAVNKVTGMASGAVNAATGMINSGVNAVNTTVGAVKQAANFITGGMSASDIKGIPADIIANSYTNSNLKFKDDNLLKNTETGNFSTGFTDSLKEFSTAMKSATNAFTGEVRNLTKKGLTFIASTTGKMVDGIDLPGLEELKGFVNMGMGQLGKLASMGKEALSSVTEGLKAVTQTVSDIYQCGKQAVDTVVSSVSEIGNAVLAPIKDIVETAYTLTDPRFYGGIVSENLSFLPGPLADIAGQKVAKMVSSVTGDIHKKTANILNKTYALETLFGIGSTESLLSNVYSYGNGYGSYGTFNNPYDYNLSGAGSTIIPGVSYFVGNKNQYVSIAEAVGVLCGDLGLDLDGIYDFGDDRDLFDVLLQMAMQTNAGQLIKALMNCGQGNQDYYSGRSLNLIRTQIGNVALSGDTYSYRALIENKGTDVVKDERTDILALYTNAKADDQSKADLSAIMDEFYMSPTEVLTTSEKIGKHAILDSQRVTVIQKAEKDYQKMFLNQDDYAAVNAAMALYA